MTTYPAPRAHKSNRSGLVLVLAASGRGALLLPRGLAALVATLAGRTDFATRMLRPGAPEAPRSVVLRRLRASVVGLLVGVLALIPVGIEALFVARGVLYGLVDHGPYNHSWGGPSMAGAWAAHFAISLPFAALGLVVLAALDALHRQITAPLVGRRTPAWAVPVTLVACAAGVLLFVSWLHQI